ncbi:MAG: OmpA family protein [Candidatus Margulisbacteria bacterium]|nr:OmpA family protein [Candidatus Margulisiibacteriota bacterium]
MKPRTAENENDDDAGTWIFTYADMISLLFAFFVILYTMSKVDQQKYIDIAQSLKQTFTKEAVMQKQGTIINPQSLQKAMEAKNIGDVVDHELNNIMQKVNSFIYKENLQTKISTFIDDRGVVVKIADDVLFDSGQADFNKNSKDLLNNLVMIVKQYPYPIRIEGHTDDTPIRTTMFPSNWELSTARACNVVRYFIDHGLNPRLFSAEGFGEYRPIANNNTPSGKAKNRRVEVIYKRDQMLKEWKKNVSPKA